MSQLPPELLRPTASFRALPGRLAETSIGCGVIGKRPGWDVRDFTPSSLAAVLCLRGSGAYIDQARREWPLAPGSLFLRRTGLRHSVRIDPGEPWAECWLMVVPEFETALAAVGILPADPVIQTSIDLTLVRELRRTAGVLAAAGDHALGKLLVQLVGILVSLLDRTDAHHTTDEFDLELACRLLAEDPRANIHEVARELGLGWERFRKLFRQRAGVSPGAYRLRRRMERAQAELVSSRRTVQDIAADLGYANPFTFSRLFHRHIGCTPVAWRSRHIG